MGHELYGPEDFTPEELDRRNALATAVTEGGLRVCRRCGASEAELDDHPTCKRYRWYVRVLKLRSRQQEG